MKPLTCPSPSGRLFPGSWSPTHVWDSSPNWEIVLRVREGAELRGAERGDGKQRLSL